MSALYAAQKVDRVPDLKQVPVHGALLGLFERKLQSFVFTKTVRLRRRTTDGTVGYHIHFEQMSSCETLTHPQARTWTAAAQRGR
jgi:hypothetical protein